ncbi:SusD/RagB family nutrient-binding outer membrane lipoprotein [Parabacteroides distasonis]|uniref:SusD/RagB family nutrient-binding outer membrane lipoprotein n=1 Tax=Parabacteroides distasonis TaxID=823 RepID=UPI00189EE583|nr:SusD/RagB family nutrient-binding outer membrane lipoprotein [Parabacteroides distasonis]MDB9152785.1 SusD/RagB family nutrient-binding outer membrane lipoprotein [Parabacteroides distasonis]MDB9157362.1 SusD/RagB family nutrient-binding outer membrane lipoprotein [Parabacteroides distasonis]MDB9166377.1 SusD/RagB family nutrient-binding outer membrane lipoprotein [Parabacteroides distasonis]MDB9170796.1 SusD/RagB family nutrient-binding outer membrane lipoprotein [Parabacteroides distasonis
MKTKNIIILGTLTIASLMTTTGCSDFEDINKDPNKANIDQVQPEWFFNNSIIGAQMNPEIAERIFVLMWKRAAHFDRGSGFTLGADNDEYNKLYFTNNSYGVGWLNRINQAIEVANLKIAEDVDNAYPYYRNIPAMARIWRAYLNSELSDNFGPLPALSAFTGVPGEYNTQEDIYKYILQELKEAQSALDESINMDEMEKSDPIFSGDVSKWKKYAGSLRMRLAMRLSVVDPTLAKAEFEDAAKGAFISESGDIAQVAEKDGWDDLTGVMSRTWNPQPLSVTFSNLVVGLGGTEFNVPNELKANLKDPYTYLGQNINLHFPTTTNDPCAGYYFDGIPRYVDPRAPKMYSITGYDDGEVYSDYIGAASNVKETITFPGGTYTDALSGQKVTAPEITLPLKYTWTTCVAGNWNDKSGLVGDYLSNNYNFPSLAKKFRLSTNKRVWFGPWESYFLLAEAAVYGWNVPGTAKENYEKGIAASFEYNGVSDKLSEYLQSKAYNRVGTSVAFDHTEEAKAYTINYYDAYAKQNKTTTYTYPKNMIYKNGQYNNDALTKIITQKYIAQNPWLPLEVWSDHRRLGLPFFENQAVEAAYNPMTQVLLTPSTSKECKVEFYPKRLRYPAVLQTNNLEGYNQALERLGGPNMTTTSLWWNMK